LYHRYTPSTYPLSLHDALPILFYTRSVLLDRERDRRTSASVEDREPVTLRCAACDHRITDDAYRIEMSGSHEHTFVNPAGVVHQDRKSTRLNSSHGSISYAVFC